jgi:hypothetical protein
MIRNPNPINAASPIVLLGFTPEFDLGVFFRQIEKGSEHLVLGANMVGPIRGKRFPF